jgi:signal transduction histidine kinase
MLVAIGLVTGLAYWDADRESRAALDDFAHEQSTLAFALAVALAPALHGSPPGPAGVASLGAIERPGAVRVLVARPDAPGLVGVDGHITRSPRLEAEIAQGTDGAVRLGRVDAAALALPARMAMAGLASFRDASGARWTVAVVASARGERDRAERALARLVLGVVLASALAVAFGAHGMRRQRAHLELEHRLDVAEILNARDETLVRADKLATMGALATGIAHEVSTPLGVILARAEQLMPKQDDDRARRAIETIVEQTERISSVVRGFLSLARGERPMLARHRPGELVGAAVGLVEHRFAKARVRLTEDVAQGLPRVACDPRLFEHVLVNLLLNACDACTDGGSVMLAVRRDGDRVAFVVDDDGAGISPTTAARATEPFFTTKPAGEGTGLGLAIASEIVKHHLGSLAISPRDGGAGTRVSVELPASGDDA